jgi:hypothetical protein
LETGFRELALEAGFFTDDAGLTDSAVDAGFAEVFDAGLEPPAAAAAFDVGLVAAALEAGFAFEAGLAACEAGFV